MTEDEYLKRNAIKIARHHREHCPGQECDISLFALYELLEKAGIDVTEDMDEFV